MTATFYGKRNKVRLPASNCLIENKKTIILKRLEKAIHNLKEARKEIHKAVRLTLEMKDAGDGIADKIIVAVAETFASDGNSLILRDYISETN